MAVAAAAAVGLATHPRAVLAWIYPVYYRDVIVHWALERRLDPWLVAAVVRMESNFSTTAVSSRGAMGLMQLLPETARWVVENGGVVDGRQPARRLGPSDFAPDLLYDPELNVLLGTWYLAYLLKAFGGQETLALAAYNAGENRVRRWVEEAGWDGSLEGLDSIPYDQTRRFVRQVFRMRRLYRWIYGGGASDAGADGRADALGAGAAGLRRGTVRP